MSGAIVRETFVFINSASGRGINITIIITIIIIIILIISFVAILVAFAHGKSKRILPLLWRRALTLGA
jgi:hypothetical protein